MAGPSKKIIQANRAKRPKARKPTPEPEKEAEAETGRLSSSDNALAHLGSLAGPAKAEAVLELQRRYGNRRVRRMLGQTGQAAEATEEEDGQVSAELAHRIDQAQGQGRPLDTQTRAEMEASFERDFGRVRVHTDRESESLNQEVNATAFTTGQDIFFSEGTYSPGSTEGQKLLAHELTHVVQQENADGSVPSGISSPQDASEREADRVAQDVVSHQKVARQPMEEGELQLAREADGSNVTVQPAGLDPKMVKARVKTGWELILFGMDIQNQFEQDSAENIGSWLTAGISGFIGGEGWTPPGHEIWEGAELYLEKARDTADTNVQEANLAVEIAFIEIQRASGQWDDWMEASGAGAEITTNYVLKPAVIAGAIAAAVVTGGAASAVGGTVSAVAALGGATATASAGVGIAAGAVVTGAGAGLYAGAQETATQGGEMLAGSREEFDLWRIGAITLKEFVKNFAGAMVGGYLQPLLKAGIGGLLVKHLGVAAEEVTEKMVTQVLAFFVTETAKAALMEALDWVLTQFSPAAFGQPEDLIAPVADEFFGNQAQNLGEYLLEEEVLFKAIKAVGKSYLSHP